MATPYLPQHDPDPATREALLAACRERYVYDAEVLPPFVLARSLPAGEDLAGGSFGARLSSAVGDSFNAAAFKLAALIDRFDELQDYEDLFRLYDPPAVVQTWRGDGMFAEQRLAGVECRLLRRADRLPADLRLPAAQFTALTGLAPDRAAGEGRLYVADYALLDGVEVQSGRHLYAPIALFCWRDEPGSEDMSRETPRRGRLHPVAIQLAQRPAAGNLYTPQDGVDWLLARTAVQAADYTLHTLGHHLAISHLAMERFAMATARQLAEVHPLAVLLRPHLRRMLAQDALLRRSFLNPGGHVERLFAPTLAGSREIAARAYRQWNLGDWALPRDLATRGVDDPEYLPHYPFRDDGLLIWQALADYVRDYLNVYYDGDADVHADVELRAWLGELADLPGAPVWPLTRADLLELVTTIVFTAGPDHSSLTTQQWEYAAYVPNMPMALYAPLPPRGADESALLAMLPAQGPALAQLEVVHAWTAYQQGRLGQYRDDDPLLTGPERVHEVVTAFQERLACIEGEIAERNEDREFAYRGMLPSKLDNSAGS
jgi:arachidonate 15-lipoxygenase